MSEGCGRKIGPFDCCTVVEGDCLDVVAQMPNQCVDLVVTSPPYNKRSKDRKPHATDTWSGGNAAISYGVFDDFLPEEEYQAWQIETINECLRILRAEGSFFYNHKNRTVDKGIITPYEWILKTNAVIKEEIVWNRKMIVEVDKVRFYPKTERIYWLIKQRVQPRFNPEYAALTDVWEILPCQKENRHGHPAPYPETLAQNCVLAVTEVGGVVFDPFVGSGTTIVMANGLGRHFFGCDINPEYVEMARKRLSTVQMSYLT